MAKCSLRSYLTEIDTLIDQSHIDEAIAHCKHILKQYPKHIETYRLLGKAFLESHRYGEAADVFQRILSVIPDDFIAHIGLSIIREDESNLDAAIWHMERAFEVQPSNAAIQEEIRRLYGQRDGVKPPKIRLTRGALIRMYAHGELYQQAIAEAKTALAEDPKRIDIEILLARLYYLSSQKIEATELCSQIISKLPFCYEANKILSIILTEAQKTAEAKKFQQRIYAVEPYAAFINQSSPIASSVPDQAVLIEKLDYSPESTIEAQPIWMQSLGVNMEEQENELPDWLPAIETPITTSEAVETEPSIEETSPFNQPADDAVLPDWMESAGWQITDKTPKDFEEMQRSEPFETLEAEPEEIKAEAAIGELPEWLLPLKEISESTIDQEQSTENEIPISTSEIIDKMGITEADESEESVSFEDQTPEWLKNFDIENEVTENIVTPENLDENKISRDILVNDNFELIEEQQENFEKVEISNAPNAEVGNKDEVDLDSAFAWLENLAAQHGAGEDTLTISKEDRLVEAPEWIKTEIETEFDNTDFRESKISPNKDELSGLIGEILVENEVPKETGQEGILLPVESVDEISGIVQESISLAVEPPTETIDFDQKDIALSETEIGTPLNYIDDTVLLSDEMELREALTSIDQMLAKGMLNQAQEGYDKLIASSNQMEEIIQHLQNALYQYPVDVSLWQLLGDAYTKAKKLQDALAAYTKAEELLS